MQLSLSLFYLVKYTNYRSHTMFLAQIVNASMLNIIAKFKKGNF